MFRSPIVRIQMRSIHAQQEEAERQARERASKRMKEQDRARELAISSYNELPSQLANAFARLEGMCRSICCSSKHSMILIPLV